MCIHQDNTCACGDHSYKCCLITHYDKQNTESSVNTPSLLIITKKKKNSHGRAFLFLIQYNKIKISIGLTHKNNYICDTDPNILAQSS